MPTLCQEGKEQCAGHRHPHPDHSNSENHFVILPVTSFTLASLPPSASSKQQLAVAGLRAGAPPVVWALRLAWGARRDDPVGLCRPVIWGRPVAAPGALESNTCGHTDHPHLGWAHDGPEGIQVLRKLSTRHLPRNWEGPIIAAYEKLRKQHLSNRVTWII